MKSKNYHEDVSFVLSDALTYIKDFIDDNSIQLVYLDPPFFSQKIQSQYNKNEDRYISFNDKWENKEEYLTFIKNILIECKEKLNNSGLIFLHCDTSANHYLRILLDEVFGEDLFINEIVWAYKKWSNSSKKLLDGHQTIWVYAKTKNYKFKHIFISYSPTTNIDQILQQRKRDINGKVIYKRNEDNSVVATNEKHGVPLRDVWELPFLNPKAKERVGYPTQKPIELLKRIIRISCDENDLILDPFCGSGSLGIAASILKCKYIGLDINEDAIKICNSRIKNYYISHSEVLDGNYSSFNNLEKEIKDFITGLNGFPIERNKGLDGIITFPEGLAGLRFQRDNESLSTTINLIKKASFSKPLVKLIVIKTHDGELFEFENSNVIILESVKYALTKALRNN